MAHSVHVGMSEVLRAGLLAESRLRSRFGVDIPTEHWTPALRMLRDTPVLSRIDHITESIRSRPDAADEVIVCDALCAHIATFRDGELDSFEKRTTFVEYARKQSWPVLQKVALKRIEQADLIGDAASTRGLEQKLMLWLEQFENRILLEELRLAREQAVGGATLFGDFWNKGAWGLFHPWDQQELSGWTSDEILRWLSERRRRFGGSTCRNKQAECARSDRY